MNELISVIVPIYNDEKYLRRCIDSIINQTYSNIEVLLILDGSTDSSYQICKSYHDNRIKIFQKENGGTADTRNYGLDRAEGKYITFCDTDDFYDTKILEILYKGISSTNSDISAVGYKEINENNITNEKTEYIDEYQIMNQEEAFRNLFNDDKFGNFVWNKLFKKELFKTIRFRKVRKIEDMAVMYLIFNEAQKVSFNKSKLYNYVQRESSQLHKKSFSVFVTKFIEYGKKYEFVKKKYPHMIENDIEYTKVILECYPFIMFNKAYRKKANNDIRNLLSITKDYLTEKEKMKVKLFGFNN